MTEGFAPDHPDGFVLYDPTIVSFCATANSATSIGIADPHSGNAADILRAVVDRKADRRL